jgi:opacity protein-like surface antigen
MKNILINTAILAALVSPNAFAEDAKTTNAYIGAELGYSKVKNDSQELANELVSEVGGSVIVTQDTGVATGRLFAGYNINENFAVELGYLHTTDINVDAAGVTGNSVAYTAAADISLKGVDYAVLIRPSTSTGLNGLFAKVGGHYLKASTDISLTTSSSVSLSDSFKGGGFLLGLGYQAPISSNIDARATYTYYDNVAGEDGHANVFSLGILAKF